MARTKQAARRRTNTPKAVMKLAQGRPPGAHKPNATLSNKVTKKTIRTHHQLNKQLAQAEAKGDEIMADELKERIKALGGLRAYQRASIQGQAADRGGDSSAVLMQWLSNIKPELVGSESKLRMLEIGALSTENACSKSGLFTMERIDLESVDEGILQQDFMERSLPHFSKDQFDIISLSLVLNFVPDPVTRGAMLIRTCRFLDQRVPRSMPESLQNHFPALFMVLPAACIMNSRFMNEERLTLLMASLGYILLKTKQTAKVVYYLWQLRDRPVPGEQDFKKMQVNPGPVRNNFSIVLRKAKEDVEV